MTMIEEVKVPQIEDAVVLRVDDLVWIGTDLGRVVKTPTGFAIEIIETGAVVPVQSGEPE